MKKPPLPLTKSRASRGTEWGVLLASFTFLVAVALAKADPSPASPDCDEIGETCCASKSGGVCDPVIISTLICVHLPGDPILGICRDSATLPPSSSCDEAGEPCCTAPTGEYCMGGLSCDVSTCQNPASPPTTFGGFCDPDGPSGPKAGDQGISTALGCLDITGSQTVSQVLGWAVGVGGGIAFLLIVYAGFQMATASGDPKRVKASQELLTAAIGGLVLIVLSVVLLNFIGISVLNLKDLGFQNP